MKLLLNSTMMVNMLMILTTISIVVSSSDRLSEIVNWIY